LSQRHHTPPEHRLVLEIEIDFADEIEAAAVVDAEYRQAQRIVRIAAPCLLAPLEL
jgi:hypothetical protein